MNKSGNLVYMQSGGPTAVINASAQGVIREAMSHKDRIGKVFAGLYGIDGLINDRLLEITADEEKNIGLLSQTPGAAFGSARHQLGEPASDDAEYQAILAACKKHDIRFILLNGGNDSMDTTAKLKRFFGLAAYQCSVIGIPKTIDNDLMMTDHCPGYASAAMFIVNAVSAIQADCGSYRKGRINIIEVMGRDTGWLAAASGLANPHPDLIYVPELAFDIKDFMQKAAGIYKEKGSSVIVISEGIRDKSGNFVAEQKTSDAFAHIQLGGAAAYLAGELKRQGFPVRAIEFSLAQRCASYLASAIDIKEAAKAGRMAVKAALEGQTGKMVVFRRNRSKEYRIAYALSDVGRIAGQTRYLPLGMLNNDGTSVSLGFKDYLSPLLRAQNKLVYENGVLTFSRFPKKEG